MESSLRVNNLVIMSTNPQGYMNSYYKKHKKKWNNPTEIHKRVKRNKARRIVAKVVGKAALKGKDVDHKVPLKSGGKTVKSNLRILKIKKKREQKKKKKRNRQVYTQKKKKKARQP